MAFTCPVCGYPDLTEPPHDPQWGTPSLEICPSCYFQFGYDDLDRKIAYETWRERWVRERMPWRSRNPVPEGWDPPAQLATLPASSQ